MTDHLKTAKEKLNIVSVNLRKSYVQLGDDVDERDLTVPIEIQGVKAQEYKGVSGIRENEIEFEENGQAWEYRFLYKIGYRLVSLDSQLVEREDAVADVHAEDIDSIEDVKILVEFRAEFVAIYLSSMKLSKEETESFKEKNVGYHIWPYWREFVQSSCGKLAITTIPVPFYSV